ncbi:glycosyltransferase [Sphingomonas nostoxanthinifaciens]|uniref:glycosyltransferase n=1 Tax=Sphingomonas nostoxanthinifaciens TaxID=2872652 RepID=UPI001CC1D4D5|nr:glycosyltransferase [Sphingomonas nostoxanthinifaciens]UAK26086.1 glycosyltransferase [Sphingomonas nostoxanthinifaciens]
MHDFALGGTERIAVRLASRWAMEGAAVTILCGSGEGEMRALLDPAVQVVAAPQPIARGRGSRLRLARAAAAHFGREPVDAVFLPGNFHWPVAPALAALPRAHRPAIVAQVSAALAKPQRRALRQFLFGRRMRLLLKGADAIVALSDAATAQAERMVGRPIVATIPLPALEDHMPAPLPVPDGPPIILAAGRLVPEKGFDLLIVAFARLDRGDAELVIVGEGPDRARLERLIAQHGLTARVRMPGYVADTRDWLDRARLFVLPSRFEGYPAVLIEALAAGRPAIVTNCTPASELIDDPVAGRIVPIDDAPAMTAAMAAMLVLPPSDPVQLAIRVERHRIGPVAWHYLALFTGLAASRR